MKLTRERTFISKQAELILTVCSILASSRCGVRGTALLNEAGLQAEELQAQQELTFGVDVSFPMHHAPPLPGDCEDEKPQFQTPLEQFASDRRQFYRNNFLKGCIEAHGEEDCLRSEEERIKMSLRQPATMRNLTQGLGFHKTRLPEDLFQHVLQFWEFNKHRQVPEEWPAGSTYVNHWDVVPSVLKVDNDTLTGGGEDLTNALWEGVGEIIAEWTGHALDQTSMYGIRIYKEGSILATHVDRQPLVSSAIINVAQDLDELWPLEVIGTDGIAYNVTMLPGDLVLYESHSLLHGVSTVIFSIEDGIFVFVDCRLH